MGFEVDRDVHGQVAKGFERVRDVFVRNFTDDVEVGAGLCIVHRGEVVVDLWGGHADRDQERPWQEDTLVNVYSTTKGLGAAAVAWAVANTDLDYAAPVSRYWPELRAAGGGLTVGELLAHMGGLCGVDAEIRVEDLYDWDKMIALLEAQAPHWPPGTAAGYHAIVWGYLAGELVRRVTDRTLGAVFRDELAIPLAADCFIGLPAAEHHRVADLIGPNHARIQPDMQALMSVKMPPLYPVALQNPSIRPFKDACSADWRAAEIAAANGQCTARGIATIYGVLVDGRQQLMSADAVREMATQEWGDEEDLVLGRALRRGRGVILNTTGEYGPNADAFGHAGAGGSLGFADPTVGLGFGYVMNQMQFNLNEDTRVGRLVRATYDALKQA